MQRVSYDVPSVLRRIWATVAGGCRFCEPPSRSLHNRTVRKLDLTKVDFDAGELVRVPMDKERTQDFEDVTPRK